jgi:hypothetical protein
MKNTLKVHVGIPVKELSRLVDATRAVKHVISVVLFVDVLRNAEKAFKTVSVSRSAFQFVIL